MLSSLFHFPVDRAPRVLLLGAHCDDIEIGCGGLVSQLVAAHPNADIRWIVFSSTDVRAQEAKVAADAFSHGIAKVSCETFRNGFFPSEFDLIKDYFETLKNNFEPDLIITHYKQDGHQDHRVISDLTWNTYRSHMILEYEIIKYDGDLGNPGIFIPLTQQQAQDKATAIHQIFNSQQHRQWFTEDTFMGLMRIRGIQCAASQGFAEGFYARKMCLKFQDT